MERFKNTVSTVWSGICRVVTRRVFAAVVMCAVTVSMVLGISVNSHVVTVNDGDESRVVVTVHQDPYRVLNTAGVQLEEHDAISVDTDSAVIDVDRAMAVEVQADGLSTLVHLTEGTVKEAISKAGISVGAQDTVSQKLSDNVAEGMLIVVDRVAYEEYTVTEIIPHGTKYRYSAVLKPGKTRTEKAGSDGEKVITYRKTIVNGKATTTEKVGEKIVKQAVDTVVLKGSSYGTPISPAPFDIELDEKGQPVNYTKKFSGSCTAYATGTRGASGMKLGVGTVAVNPKQIPYGTKLWITSADGKFVYGYAIAADTGGFIHSGKTIADLYMGSYKEACNFGRRNLNIYVIG